jgi:hypothetical protein
MSKLGMTAYPSVIQEGLPQRHGDREEEKDAMKPSAGLVTLGLDPRVLLQGHKMPGSSPGMTTIME